MTRAKLRETLAAKLESLGASRNRKVLLSALVGFVIVYPIVLIGLTDFAWPTQRSAAQPIAFNHKLHLEGVGLTCADCHEFFASETFSGLPQAETCAMCHEAAQGESREEIRLVALLEQGEPLRWQSLFRQPAHVFYSHRRHATVAEIACEQCHGSFTELEAPPSAVEVLSMEACIECHEQAQAGTDCTDCHR